MVLVGPGVTRMSDPTTNLVSAAFAWSYDALKQARLVPSATISPTMITALTAAQERRRTLRVRRPRSGRPKRRRLGSGTWESSRPSTRAYSRIGAEPDADRDDDQLEPERHRPPVVDRAADPFEGTRTPGVQDEQRQGHQDQDVEPEPPPQGPARGQLGPLFADLPPDRAEARGVQRHAGGHESAPGTQRGRAEQAGRRGPSQIVRRQHRDRRNQPQADPEH